MRQEERCMNDAFDDDVPVLGEDVPVTMPTDLPSDLVLATPEQYKAMGDPVRVRILHSIQFQPATAKQLADRFGLAPGSVGHHLHVLEEAGLAKVVARRMVRNTIAKYYARAARIFLFAMPPDAPELDNEVLQMLSEARDELKETIKTMGPHPYITGATPRARMTSERAQAFEERLAALVYEFLREPPDPEGQVYTMSIALFVAPAALQVQVPSESVQDADDGIMPE
jgi:DNA-binding transcriptional ArsR family regulator